MRDLLRILARRLGYGLLRVTRASPGVEHELVVPTATWSPWNLDRGFLATWEEVRRHTLKDKYRCWELWTLVAEAAAHPAGAILEVGVWRGGSGALLARRARDLGLADPIYLCDTFRGVAKAGPEDPGYQGGEHADTSRQRVVDLVERLRLDDVHVLAGVFPDETGDRVPAGPIRLCHVDVDVYASARDVLAWVWPRLPPGGIVVFDDYGFRFCDGVTRLVDEQRGRADRVVLHNLNGHGIVVKVGSS